MGEGPGMAQCRGHTSEECIGCWHIREYCGQSVNVYGVKEGNKVRGRGMQDVPKENQEDVLEEACV